MKCISDHRCAQAKSSFAFVLNFWISACSRLRFRLLLALPISLFGSHSAWAEEIPNDNESPIKLSGFGTIGVSYNTERQFDYLRDLLQTSGVGASRRVDFGLDSVLGVQVSGNLSENIEATVQTVVRRRESNYRPEVNWAFLKFYPSNDWDLRVGRLGFDVYPLADSRNVAYSYTWVRPPVEYFGGLIVSYIDGVDAAYNYELGTGQTRIKMFAGKAQERVLVEAPNLYFSLRGSKIFGAHLEFQSQRWLARMGYAELKFANDYPRIQSLIDALKSPMMSQISPSAASFGQEISFKDKKIRYLSAGLVFDDGPFQAQLMLSKLNSETLSFNSNMAGFFTMAYRHKDWTPYITYAKTRPKDTKAVVTGLPIGVSPIVDQVEAGVQSFLKATRNEQSSRSIGIRYNLSQSSDIRLQIDMINNKERLIVRRAAPDWNGKGTIISCTYNFIFN
jgi:hypothetical protein